MHRSYLRRKTANKCLNARQRTDGVERNKDGPLGSTAVL